MKKIAATLLLVLSSVVALDVASASAAAPITKSMAVRLRYVAPTKKPTPGAKVGINPQPLPPRVFLKR
jgi:hypothetical protein